VTAFWPIFKRELFAFFVTPLAWVLIVVFLVVQGLHFFLLVDHFSSMADLGGDETPLSAFFGNTVLLYMVLLVLVPPMTMRLFAEERRSGTIESLMTAPVSSLGVVLAKYAAVLLTYVLMRPLPSFTWSFSGARVRSTGTPRQAPTSVCFWWARPTWHWAFARAHSLARSSWR
jgi:ABC-type transport system involved in multi-copper enzyme maturation permease subunit